jgi:hypothetical protein
MIDGNMVTIELYAYIQIYLISLHPLTILALFYKTPVKGKSLIGNRSVGNHYYCLVNTTQTHSKSPIKLHLKNGVISWNCRSLISHANTQKV